MKASSSRPVVVFSGVNLVEGGPLSVFKDAIDAFIKFQLKEYKLIVLVNNLELFREYSKQEVLFIERRNAKNSYLRRIWFEYVECYYLSKKMQPFLWFALHDMTPNVRSVKKVVYCHNPGPFYKASFKEARIEPTFFLFTLFYKFLYKINIKSNNYIIVQQEWIREFFLKEFDVENVIVAHPKIFVPVLVKTPLDRTNRKFSFFYPAFPRVFKNFETLLEATKILLGLRNDFEVIITIKGNENRYAQSLYRKYNNLPQVKFIGIQPREEVIKLYQEIDCLVFPSKLETWGLPISEIQFFNKPMLVADEKYARETAGKYKKVQYFVTEDAKILSSYMNAVIDGSLQFSDIKYQKPRDPFSENWPDLLNLILT
jgi:glycosyltransferase involved in cell wall biosynthesis